PLENGTFAAVRSDKTYTVTVQPSAYVTNYGNGHSLVTPGQTATIILSWNGTNWTVPGEAPYANFEVICENGGTEPGQEQNKVWLRIYKNGDMTEYISIDLGRHDVGTKLSEIAGNIDLNDYCSNYTWDKTWYRED